MYGGHGPDDISVYVINIDDQATGRAANPGFAAPGVPRTTGLRRPSASSLSSSDFENELPSKVASNEAEEVPQTST